MGAGVGIGAAVWSGGSGSEASAAPARGFSSPPKLERVRNAPVLKNYDHGFTLYAQRGLTWTPDYADSNCGVPRELKANGYTSSLGDVYRGNATIADSGSCFFEKTYVYWKTQSGTRFGLRHGGGSWDCSDNCEYTDRFHETFRFTRGS